MRHLATIREIASLRPIAGADRIEVAQVDGWECVVQKGEFHAGEHKLCFILTSKESREFYFLYELVDGEFKKLGKARTPKELEDMSKERLGQYITTLSEEHMKQVAEANLLATGAIAYLDIEALLAVWKKAAALNAVVPA